jgi:pyruvate ferredoxin oxidoreductase alpha subunit
MLQAFRIAEHLEVQLPVMVGLDGFTLSHTLEDILVFSGKDVQNFVKVRELPKVTTHEGKAVPFKLDPANPMTIGPVAYPNYYFEFKRQQEEAMRNAYKVIQQVHDEYADLSGRHYGDGLLDAYKLDDAEFAIVCIGSTAGTVKTVVDELRDEGVKAGLLRIRTFRPFPAKEIAKALANVRAVAVLDRSMSFGGNGGAVFHETRHALYDVPTHPLMVDYIFGLGGRDTSPTQIRRIYEEIQKIAATKKVDEPVRFVGLRE